MRLDVEFPGHGGVTLRGWLHLPDDDVGPFPGVVMAPGFSATRDMALDGYAEAFAAVGLAVLLYDHRNLGASDGEPRQHINPWAQTRDYRRALDWLGARPEVDAQRLGAWGSSYSGGEVVVLAAADRRVKAAVANVPFAGLPDVEYGDDVDERARAVIAEVLDESGAGLADHTSDLLGPFAVVAEDGTELPPFLPDPHAVDWFCDLGRRPGSRWRNEVTIGGIRSDPKWDPGVCVHAVSPTPLLMVVALEDALADTAITIAAHDRAGEPKSLVTIPGHHFEPYAGDAMHVAIGAATDWFLRWL